MKCLAVLAAAVLALSARPAPARAQPAGDSASASKVPVARRLYEEGVEAVNKGRWSVAYERFKASYELAPRVLTLFNLAGAQVQTSRFIEASESYRKFLRETSDGRYADLRTEATQQLEGIEKQVAHLTLDVANLHRDDEIAIDGVEFPHAALRESIPMNPGPHAVTARRDGEPIASEQVTLAAGAAESLKLQLPERKVDLRARPREGGRDGDGALVDRPPTKKGGGVLRSPWFWTAAAIVVAGGATGAYFLTRSDEDVLVVR